MDRHLGFDEVKLCSFGIRFMHSAFSHEFSSFQAWLKLLD